MHKTIKELAEGASKVLTVLRDTDEEIAKAGAWYFISGVIVLLGGPIIPGTAGLVVMAGALPPFIFGTVVGIRTTFRLPPPEDKRSLPSPGAKKKP